MIQVVHLDHEVERITGTKSTEHDLSYFFTIALGKGYCKVSLCNRGKTLQIDHVQVEPAYRGNGYGSAMLLYAIALARSFGCFLCTTVLIDSNNESALGMFNSLGFITVPFSPSKCRATFVIY